ncbi:ice-binding family protein [Arthrobacter cryoconiti]|uniref:Ice-binding family protein n=1 Tax=Arthrobacter cryoconiti TaxID=748907 RepID=A0ABV8QY10_9MICC|nr:ice-binding family protein [Arthrobacter cryoconiti]MCC9067707.1 ice-binding family protein [Arthrobacter cryoconiti]
MSPTEDTEDTEANEDIEVHGVAEAPSRVRVRRSTFRQGWTWLALVTSARIYLFLLLTLAAFALVPALFGMNASVVQSGSMRPHIRPGDVVLTTALPQGSPVSLGRVVQFRSPPEAEVDGIAKLRLHRVVAAGDDGTFVTAGDANESVDSVPLNRAQITGEARVLVPFVGLPGYWMGIGKYLPLFLWALFTLGALCAMIFDEPAEPPERPGPRNSSRVSTRRAFFALTGAGALAAVLAISRPSTVAAFTTRTSNVASSWKIAAQAPLSLGRAAGYALLASTRISNTGFFGGGTDIGGSIGTSPGTTITGFYFWNVSGSEDTDTASARNAQTDAATLYAAAGSRPTGTTRSQTLNGTITPGVYASSSGGFTVPGTLTLDARGDPSAVFIFKANSFTAAANSTVRLINRASAKNIYWRIAGAVTFSSYSTSVGHYIATGNIAFQSNSSLAGHALSLSGSISTVSTSVTIP